MEIEDTIKKLIDDYFIIGDIYQPTNICTFYKLPKNDNGTASTFMCLEKPTYYLESNGPTKISIKVLVNNEIIETYAFFADSLINLVYENIKNNIIKLT